MTNHVLLVQFSVLVKESGNFSRYPEMWILACDTSTQSQSQQELLSATVRVPQGLSASVSQFSRSNILG